MFTPIIQCSTGYPLVSLLALVEGLIPNKFCNLSK